jgi:hypothetical protein
MRITTSFSLLPGSELTGDPGVSSEIPGQRESVRGCSFDLILEAHHAGDPEHSLGKPTIREEEKTHCSRQQRLRETTNAFLIR